MDPFTTVLLTYYIGKLPDTMRKHGILVKKHFIPPEILNISEHIHNNIMN